MLTHHDGRSYVEAASDAARFARGIMEKKIAEGRVSAQALLERVHTFVPQDAVVRSRALEFADDPELGQLHVHYGDQVRSLHGHALGQLASKADIPTQYLRELAAGAPWQRGLAAHALNEHMHQGHDKERYLLRPLGHEAYFLLDRYRLYSTAACSSRRSSFTAPSTAALRRRWTAAQRHARRPQGVPPRRVRARAEREPRGSDDRAWQLSTSTPRATPSGR